jgi:PhnB protein
MGNQHIRHGIGAIRPFLYGRLDLLEFVKQVFGAVELERNIVPGGFNVQAQIGDAVLVMAAMDPPYEAATRASVYVFVDDVDAAYARAIAAGATSLSAPTDKPFQERSCGVKDSFGNIWYISKYTGKVAN